MPGETAFHLTEPSSESRWCHLKDSNDGRQDSGEPCVSGPHLSHGRDLFRTRFSKLRTWLKIFSLHCPLASVESP